jgi:phosphonate transport system substrate-binding protein
MAADLGSYDYLGRHDKVGHAVGIGQYDAGALKESTFAKLLKKGVPIRALAEFQNVTKPWIAHSGLGNQIFIALQESLLELKDSAALKPLKKDGFVTGSDEDYSMIRKSIIENYAFFQSL